MDSPTRSRGRGRRGLSPLEFLEVKKHYNWAKKQINVQQSVLNADSKKSLYNFTTFNRVRRLLSH